MPGSGIVDHNKAKRNEALELYKLYLALNTAAKRVVEQGHLYPYYVVRIPVGGKLGDITVDKKALLRGLEGGGPKRLTVGTQSALAHKSAFNLMFVPDGGSPESSQVMFRMLSAVLL